MDAPFPLSDSYGRVARDLRVSLTDRCNLRCTYWMPAEGLDWLADERILTDDEVVRLVSIAVRLLGVDDVRFTGGEPLVRRGFVDIVQRCAQLEPRPQLSVTTNALGLARQAVALKDAGLVEEAARAAGLDLPLARTIAERMQMAVDAGHGDEDMAAAVEAGRS